MGKYLLHFAHSANGKHKNPRPILKNRPGIFFFNERLRQLSDRGELGEQKRSFRPVSPSRNSHRSGATHFPMADGEGGSAYNRPYRLCSSLPAESLCPSSIRCAACKFFYGDDPGPGQACLPNAL